MMETISEADIESIQPSAGQIVTMEDLMTKTGTPMMTEKQQVVNFSPQVQSFYQSLKNSSASGSPVDTLMKGQTPIYLNNYVFPVQNMPANVVNSSSWNVVNSSGSQVLRPCGTSNSDGSLHSLDNVVASQNSSFGYHSYYNANNCIGFRPSPGQGDPLGGVPVVHASCSCVQNPFRNSNMESDRSAFSSQVYMLKKMMPPSVTWIGVLWTLMSIVLAFLSAFSIVSSTWVLQFADSDQNGFGPMKSCRLTVEDNLYFVQHCSYFVLDNGVMNWPSSPFQVTALLYSVGTLFLMVASCFAFSSLVTLSVWRQRTSWLAGYFQLSAVLVQTFALAIFPMGFHSSFTRQMCGQNTGMYNMDRCHVGWGYVLAIVTTSLVIFCPFLSKFSTKTTKRICRQQHTHPHYQQNQQIQHLSHQQYGSGHVLSSHAAMPIGGASSEHV